MVVVVVAAAVVLARALLSRRVLDLCAVILLMNPLSPRDGVSIVRHGRGMMVMVMVTMMMDDE